MTTLVMGLLFSLLSYLVCYQIADRLRKKASSVKRTYHAKGNLSTTLEPLIPIVSGSTVTVLGYDPSLMVSSSYSGWKRLLEKWLTAGVNVVYLFHEVPAECLDLMRTEYDAFHHLPGSLEVREIQRNDATYDLLSKTKTAHFLILDQPPTLWLEGNHPVGVSTATHCELVENAHHDFRWKTVRSAAATFVRNSTLKYQLGQHRALADIRDEKLCLA